MTLGDLIQWLSAHPIAVIALAVGLPLLSLGVNLLAGDSWNRQPWLSLYSILIYLVCIPGILALTLSVYSFLFDRRDIMDLNLLVQVLPVAVMFVALAIIRRRVSIRDIPGFTTITALCVTLFALLSLGYFLDRFRILLFSRVHFGFIAVFLIAIPLAIWWVWRRK